MAVVAIARTGSDETASGGERLTAFLRSGGTGIRSVGVHCGEQWVTSGNHLGGGRLFRVTEPPFFACARADERNGPFRLVRGYPKE